MSYRTVQRAPSAASPLVILWLVGPGTAGEEDAKLRAALPGCGIVATADDVLEPSPVEIQQARTMAGVGPDAPLVVCGYSAGCQAVRALRVAGLQSSGCVTIDGTAASLPPAAWQIDVWRKLADEAKAGKTLWVATCLQQDYVERLPKGAFSWDRRVLEAALGVELPVGTEIHDGGLHVYSMPSKSIDAAAHILQQTVTLPEVLAKHVAPWLAGVSPTEPAPTTEPIDIRPSPPPALGQRVVAFYRDAMANGVCEHPPGSNDGPEIRGYFAVCRRRGTEASMKGTTGAWCSAMFSAACETVAVGGEPIPAPRCAGEELQADAEQNGSWHSIAEVRAGTWAPRIGDACILSRGVAGSWERHVCAVAVLPDDIGLFHTLGGNEDNQVKETVRHLSDPDLLGFIAIGSGGS